MVIGQQGKGKNVVIGEVTIIVPYIKNSLSYKLMHNESGLILVELCAKPYNSTLIAVIACVSALRSQSHYTLKDKIVAIEDSNEAFMFDDTNLFVDNMPLD